MATCNRCKMDAGLAYTHRRERQCIEALTAELASMRAVWKDQRDTINQLSANILELESKLKKGVRK